MKNNILWLYKFSTFQVRHNKFIQETQPYQYVTSKNVSQMVSQLCVDTKFHLHPYIKTWWSILESVDRAVESPRDWQIGRNDATVHGKTSSIFWIRRHDASATTKKVPILSLTKKILKNIVQGARIDHYKDKFSLGSKWRLNGFISGRSLEQQNQWFNECRWFLGSIFAMPLRDSG